MRIRGGFIAVLLVLVTGVVAAFAISAQHHRADQRDLRAAVALAQNLQAPAGAVESRECHGDGLVRCWTTPQAAADVAQAVAASMRAAGARATVNCDRVKVGVGASAATADECNVGARFGSHAAAVFVDPHWRRTSNGTRIDGSLVSVSAA